MDVVADVWAVGAAYEPYIGRWSRLVAREFLPWLAFQPGWRWLDVGCGTGILTRTILEVSGPRDVVGVDPSAGFLAYARAHTPEASTPHRAADTRAVSAVAHFEVGEARALPFEADAFDAVVSGLVLNFVPDPAQGLAEMLRVARPGGTVAAYVWDYADRMQLIRHCWDAAVTLDPGARDLDEGRRFPICEPEALRQLFTAAGLQLVEVRAIDVPTDFRDFDDYWSPFLSGQGPAPGYVATLDASRRATLRETLRSALPVAPDGSIHLTARAWAVRGQRQPAGD